MIRIAHMEGSLNMGGRNCTPHILEGKIPDVEPSQPDTPVPR